ncbi:flagellar basal body-associated FliL family protein [Sphingosinicella sp. CPCC 101087]|uniref:flagellar basal body-associated FliL family protein n=1 Tax=Sphingosinicella sp. CPCC 101087 TaxID=2497754 RepID=UPI00101C4D80|nr:flagellar basal body-associated FliL family protein [Sphingosinicella sp. CPCC 101087]
MSDIEQPKPKKKRSRLKKLLLLTVALVAIGGGGAGAVLYANGGVLGGLYGGGEDPDVPQLVPRDGANPASVEAARAMARQGRVDPRLFQSTYVPLEGNFTSNLRGGTAFVQLGLGISTFYDERVIDNVRRHDMAIRSAILMTLTEQDPAAVTTARGKQALKIALRNAINGVLTNREGFGGIDEVYFTSFVTQ